MSQHRDHRSIVHPPRATPARPILPSAAPGPPRLLVAGIGDGASPAAPQPR